MLHGLFFLLFLFCSLLCNTSSSMQNSPQKCFGTKSSTLVQSTCTALASCSPKSGTSASLSTTRTLTALSVCHNFLCFFCPHIAVVFFTHSTAFAMQIVNGLRPTVDRDCPRELLTLMERCWSDSPKERPSFSHLVPQLETLYQNMMASANPDTVHVQPNKY